MARSLNHSVMAHLLKMALVDGVVTPEEEVILQRQCRDLAISDAEYRVLLEDMKGGGAPECPLDPEACRTLFLGLLEVAASDALEEEEIQYLLRVAASLGLSPAGAQELIDSFQEFDADFS
ncbi:MAG: tellurite resistance TerB family protein, partial [Planctomycetota bacterium]